MGGKEKIFDPRALSGGNNHLTIDHWTLLTSIHLLINKILEVEDKGLFSNIYHLGVWGKDQT